MLLKSSLFMQNYNVYSNDKPLTSWVIYQERLWRQRCVPGSISWAKSGRDEKLWLAGHLCLHSATLFKSTLCWLSVQTVQNSIKLSCCATTWCNTVQTEHNYVTLHIVQFCARPSVQGTKIMMTNVRVCFRMPNGSASEWHDKNGENNF